MFPTLRRAVPSYRRINNPTSELSRIRVSAEEQTAARLSLHNIQKGLEEFHRNGFVILENAVRPQSVENILRRMLHDFDRFRNSSAIRWNQGRNSGNISQPPPQFPEYLHEDVWANRLGVDVMNYIIGPQPQLSFATSNIALPKSTSRQAVHSDYYCHHFDFPVFLEVNVYLHDVDSRNGATEFWPGTQNGYSKDDHSSPTTGWIQQRIFKSRATVSPPIQPAIPKGSLMIRDLRCWHAGRENQTDEPRIVLGFLYSPPWYGSHMRMKFPHSARPRLASWNHIDCLRTTKFVSDDYDYLLHQQEINLTQVAYDHNAPSIPEHRLTKVTSRDFWTPP